MHHRHEFDKPRLRQYLGLAIGCKSPILGMKGTFMDTISPTPDASAPPQSSM